MGRHEARLFHFLCQKAPSRQDAEDLTQQTFVNAWQKLHLFRSDARFVTWIYTIARNLTVSHYRKHGRVTHCELEEASSSMVDHATPEQTVSEKMQEELEPIVQECPACGRDDCKCEAGECDCDPIDEPAHDNNWL